MAGLKRWFPSPFFFIDSYSLVLEQPAVSQTFHKCLLRHQLILESISSYFFVATKRLRNKVCPSVRQFACPPVRPSVCLSIYLSVHHDFHLSILETLLVPWYLVFSRLNWARQHVPRIRPCYLISFKIVGLNEGRKIFNYPLE